MYPGVPRSIPVRVSCVRPCHCDPEVEHLDLVDATAGQEQVRGVEIAVDDPARVHRAERAGDPGRQRDRVGHRERAALEAGLEDLAVEPLHHEVRLAGPRHPVADVANDAGVLELGEHLDLAREPLRMGALRAGQDLDRHDLVGDGIAGAKHLAHGAAADSRLELEPLVEPSLGAHGAQRPTTTGMRIRVRTAG
jgi:hypothetical protein